MKVIYKPKVKLYMSISDIEYILERAKTAKTRVSPVLKSFENSNADIEIILEDGEK